MVTPVDCSRPRRFLRALGALALGVAIPFGLASAYAAAPGDEGTPAAAARADVDPGVASAARMRLVSQSQYFNTLSYIFGPEVTISAHFAPFQRTDGLLDVGASTAGVTMGQMQEFQRAAVTIAQKVVSPEFRDFLVPCSPRHDDAADDACASKFLTSVGRFLYRRPLTREEQKELVSKAGDAAKGLKDFYAGLAISLEGLLISPNTLFVIDHSEPDPKHPGARRLDAYSLASRLSYFLWDAAPDDDLLKQAEHGDLQGVVGRTKAVDRMLASPRLVTGVRAFFDDMLGFDDFAVLAKDPDIYPAFVGDAVQDAREQTLRIIVDHLLVRKRDYRDLFTTRDIFISPSLALLYRVPTPLGWTPYQIPEDSQRVGVLTQIAFLASHAHPGRSSATLRGKALRELLLCQIVPRPPPNVDFSKLEDPKSPFRTARERLTAHRSNPVCAGCHRITDPIGLALENFDGSGEFRTTERGAPIDASGNLDGKDYNDARGLAQAVHDHPGVPSCLVKRAYTYGVGGTIKANADTDRVELKYLDARFAEDGYRLPDLLRTIALSHAFSEVNEPAAPAPTQKSADAAPSHPATAGDKT